MLIAASTYHFVPYTSEKRIAVSAVSVMMEPSVMNSEESAIPRELFRSSMQWVTVNSTEADLDVSSLLVAVMVTVVSSATFWKATTPFVTLATSASEVAQVTLPVIPSISPSTVAFRVTLEPSNTVVSV